MLSCEYIVESLDGDYAHLVARALLPAEIQEGTLLKYEFLQYSIIG